MILFVDVVNHAPLKRPKKHATLSIQYGLTGEVSNGSHASQSLACHGARNRNLCVVMEHSCLTRVAFPYRI